ncbi:MAG: hypothetical protein NC086_10630 [Alistipes sp.]|nr:hypothetical protein [Alistipes sp.]
MKKILTVLLCTLLLSSCGKAKDDYTISYNGDILTLYNNDTKIMELSGKDIKWEKETVLSRNNVNVYFGGEYRDGFEHLYGNESRLEPLCIQNGNKIYYVYENEDGIMYFCNADIDTKDLTVLYAEEISDNDEIYDIKTDGNEISFMHTVFNNGEPYKNIVRTTSGNTYAVVDFYQ